MKMLCTLLIFGAVGALGRGANIDINRVKHISDQVAVHSSEETEEKNSQLIIRSNDYDDHSSWYQHPRSPVLYTPDAAQANSKTPVQVHKPREDPRLYYQSDAYLKEYGRKNVNEEVTFVYPGGDVVLAGNNAMPYSRIRTNDMNTDTKDFNMCVKCPHDRTLIAKPSLGRVVLQSPILNACSGRKAPRNVKFEHIYGPQVGSLLKQGSHMIIGRIMYKNKNIQLCKMQVHVVTQGCPIPKYLTTHCSDQNNQCNFTCTNKQFEISGPTTQICGEDMKWKGDLPICKVRTWCELPTPPERGRVSCLGAPAGNGGAGIAEGSTCRVRCARGYRSRRVTPVCRRGTWTHTLTCQPIRKRNAPKSPKQ